MGGRVGWGKVPDILNLGASYGECVSFTLRLFLPRENMDTRLSGPQGKHGRLEKKKTLFSLSGI